MKLIQGRYKHMWLGLWSQAKGKSPHKMLPHIPGVFECLMLGFTSNTCALNVSRNVYPMEKIGTLKFK